MARQTERFAAPHPQTTGVGVGERRCISDLVRIMAVSAFQHGTVGLIEGAYIVAIREDEPGFYVRRRRTIGIMAGVAQPFLLPEHIAFEGRLPRVPRRQEINLH